MLKLEEVDGEPRQNAALTTRYLESWMNRTVVVQVVNMPTEFSYPAYVGTLAGVDRDDTGSIQSILLTECTAGMTQRTYHADNVLVWPAVMRISLPSDNLLDGHNEVVEKVRSGAYIFR